MRVFNFGKSLSDWGEKSTGVQNFQCLNEIGVFGELDSPNQNRDKGWKIIFVGSKYRRYIFFQNHYRIAIFIQ
jgi:hypothetical protein